MASETPKTLITYGQTSLNAPKPQVDIDPNGDLILDVSEPESSVKRCMKVSSKTLCLASPVFRAMIGPSSRFKEGVAVATTSEEKPAELKLYGDDYNAILIIMNAMHLQTRNMPGTVTVDLLYQIALMCDKYDLAETLAPWIRIWSDYFCDFEKKPGYERWLVISWVFRQSSTFSGIVKQLILDTRLDRSGQLATAGFGSIESGAIPDSIIKAIRHEREKLISFVVSPAVVEMDNYNSNVLAGGSVCQMTLGGHSRDGGSDLALSKKRTECDNINIGALYRCLFKAGIWPVQEKTDNQTATSIIKALQSLQRPGKEIVENLGGRRRIEITHAGCSPKNRIKAAIADALGNVKKLGLADFCSEDSILFPDN